MAKAIDNSNCGVPKKKGFQKTHGLTHNADGKRSKLYHIWEQMKRRVNSDKHAKWYRDKGIVVCQEWMAYKPFHDWSMAHGYVEGLSIDRVDSDKGYSPENCEWVTKNENFWRASVKRWKNHCDSKFMDFSMGIMWGGRV